ncbi:hypothetical protein E4L95_12370 [Paracoccus liaowanqingii]|uniref:Phage major capsid protein n=1 Tax=Paracoccus liaowanqingii TaxID=2560053 RepID=A0A4Z1CLD1_9RHOB|nr:phage major capsid protein [Paracoccus liaowanqingii]TGN58598.1 hypothetical protein E4L95_12370 [Paracoccus liaowanqingii]
MTNQRMADISALSRRVEDAATVGWVARAKAMGLGADSIAEMGGPRRAVDVLSKALDTGSLTSAGATTAVMAFVENAARSSAFLAMVSDRAFRRVPFDVPLIHSASVPLPDGMIEGGLIAVAELELEGAKLKAESVGTITIASDEAWARIDGPGQSFINGLLQAAVGKAADARMFEALAGTTPIAFTADGTETAVIDALRFAMKAMLTKSGQSLRWVLSPSAAATLSTISADGRISVGPDGGTIFGITAILTDALEPGELALIAASEVAADVIDLSIMRARSASVQLPGGEQISLFQCNMSAVRAVLTFGLVPLADAVMARVTLTE